MADGKVEKTSVDTNWWTEKISVEFQGRLNRFFEFSYFFLLEICIICEHGGQAEN